MPIKDDDTLYKQLIVYAWPPRYTSAWQKSTTFLQLIAHTPSIPCILHNLVDSWKPDCTAWSIVTPIDSWLGLWCASRLLTLLVVFNLKPTMVSFILNLVSVPLTLTLEYSPGGWPVLLCYVFKVQPLLCLVNVFTLHMQLRVGLPIGTAGPPWHVRST